MFVIAWFFVVYISLIEEFLQMFYVVNVDLEIVFREDIHNRRSIRSEFLFLFHLIRLE
jgi:hypothetical protein